MASPLAHLQHDAQAAARRFALAAPGVGSSLVGVGFLTELVWRYVATYSGPLTASLSIGVAYLAVGIVVLVVAARQGTPAPSRQRDRNDLPLFELAEGFAAGMRAGRAVRAGRRGTASEGRQGP